MKCTRLQAFSTRTLVFSVVVVLLGACGGDKTTKRPGGAGGVGGGSTAGTTAGTSTTAGTGAGAGATTAGTGATAGDGVVAGTTAAGEGGAAGVGVVIGAFDAGIEPDRNMVMAGEICDRMSTIQCQGENACCDAPRPYAECKSAMMTGCMDTLYIDEIAANAITGFDAVAAEAAFTHYEDLARNCDSTVAAWGSSIDGLRSILKGTVAPGKSCPIKASDSTVKAAAALASCTDGANTACMFHSISTGGSISFPINWTCDARGGDGAKCFTDANCTDTFYCDNPDVKFNATCKPRKAPGTACENPNECASLFCKKKLCVAVDQQAAYCLRND